MSHSSCYVFFILRNVMFLYQKSRCFLPVVFPLAELVLILWQETFDCLY